MFDETLHLLCSYGYTLLLILNLRDGFRATTSKCVEKEIAG